MHAMSNFYLVCITYIIYVLVLYDLILVAVTRKEFF